eukprot:235033_1
MSSEEIVIFHPEVVNGPSEFILLTEHDDIDDYTWVLQEFDPDLTYIMYPSTLFKSYFRNYTQLLRAHAPDNVGLNSALWALTANKYGLGFYNTLWHRVYAYFTETESILNACDNHELYFKLSHHILSDTDHRVMVPSTIDKDGLFIRGVRDYVMHMLFYDKQTDTYDAHFEEHAKIDGESIAKHEYFLQLWNSYAHRDNEHEFWEYLIKWRDMIYWDYVTDSNAYLPAPTFTKIVRKSHELYPPHGPLRHLPVDKAYKSLVHDAYNALKDVDDVDKVVVIVPTHVYSEHFVKLYGNTTDDDLVHGSPYREFDSFVHPRIKPFMYGVVGYGSGYYFMRQQRRFKQVVWKRRAYRMARWTANGMTTLLFSAFGFSALYFNQISSHSYCNQTIAKQIENLKNNSDLSTKIGHTKRKWTDILFRRVVHGL